MVSADVLGGDHNAGAGLACSSNDQCKHEANDQARFECSRSCDVG